MRKLTWVGFLQLLILSTALLASEQPKVHSSAAGLSRGQTASGEKDGFVLFPGGNQADGLEWQSVVPNLSLPALAMEMPHGATAKMTRDEYISRVLSAM